jgi:hypothetical protein
MNIELSEFIKVSIDKYETDEDGEEIEIWARTLGCSCCSQSKRLTVEEAFIVCDENIKKWEQKKKELFEIRRMVSK